MPEGPTGDDGSFRSEAELHEFSNFVQILNTYNCPNGPLAVTAREFDYQFEGWQDDDLDKHKRGVKINGFSGWPRLHGHQKLTLFIFIPTITFISNLILFPIFPHPGDVISAFLFNLSFSMVVVLNMVGSLAQPADPAVFGCKRWTAREYLLWLRIKYPTHTHGELAGTLIFPDEWGAVWERPLCEFRDDKGAILPEMERLIQTHPYPKQVREAIPLVDRRDRVELCLKVQQGLERKPIYPRRRWDKMDKVMVLHGSYHCNNTNKSVASMDHFCVWLNSAVGETNYKYFLSFIQTIFWSVVVLFAMCIVVLVDSGLDETEYKVRIEYMFPDCNPTIALGFARATCCVMMLLCGALGYQMVWLNSFHLMLWRLGDEHTGPRTTTHYWHTTGEDPAKAEKAPAEQAPAEA
eukprot:Hpha_TRINITY_DN12750_c0_g1::TRINITY_DN12750_c0_g1_i2::g.114425::m.114425